MSTGGGLPDLFSDYIFQKKNIVIILWGDHSQEVIKILPKNRELQVNFFLNRKVTKIVILIFFLNYHTFRNSYITGDKNIHYWYISEVFGF